MGQPGKDTCIGSTLKEEEKGMITAILARNAYLFAWTTTNMSSIDPRIISQIISLQRGKADSPRE